jgi:hypothetical protein
MATPPSRHHPQPSERRRKRERAAKHLCEHLCMCAMQAGVKVTSR